jgi:hypothetical protein
LERRLIYFSRVFSAGLDKSGTASTKLLTSSPANAGDPVRSDIEKGSALHWKLVNTGCPLSRA